MRVIGLDLGTQSVKAVVCDERLRVLGRGASTYPTSYPEPDRAEQDPRDWERALAPAIRAALAAARAVPEEIEAISLTGQLDGCVAVDAGGAPVHPALIWQDRRAIAQAARFDAHAVFDIAGQVADPSHLAPKACWLREHGAPAARFHVPVSYLVERLCGAAVLDPAHASTTMLCELATGTWSPALLAAFAIDRAELPAIAPAVDVAGALGEHGARLTGLRTGTLVAVGTGDDFANPIGAGIVAPGAIVCTLGTAEVVGALASTPVLDRTPPSPMVETHLFPTGAFFVENPGWLSGGAVRWAARMLGLAADAELDALAAQAPPGAGGVTFVPALAGAMTPVWRPAARGAFLGLAAGHDRPHLARAVLEGLAFACRDVCERLAALGLPAHEVHVLGGGARSEVWTQLRADTLGLAHHVADDVDAAPLGAARIAAVAAGMVPSLAAAAALARPPARTFVPGAPDVRAALDEAYRRYQTHAISW